MEQKRTTALPPEAELERQMEFIQQIRKENEAYTAKTGRQKKVL